jgi:hypothetical protein
LLYATAVGLFLAVATSLTVEFGDVPVSPTVWHYTVSWVFNVVGTVALFPVLLILFVFPIGRFLTKRWRWAGWLAGVFTVAMSLVVAFSEEVGHIYDPDNEHWNLSNPIGFLQPEVAEFMNLLSVGVMMGLAVGGVVSMIVRYRRSDSLVRTQIKWVVYASAVAAVALQGISLSGGDPTLYLLSVLTALAVIPIAITVAITRYKLFEIDRLISRTVSYGLVVALLGGMFVALAWLPSVFIGGVGHDGEGSGPPPLIITASTLAVAALFNPLRKRVRHAVDRRFNRSGYQAELMSEGFAAQIREPLSTDEIIDLWTQAVGETMQPQTAGIWLKET